jgi:hypothetical protein
VFCAARKQKCVRKSLTEVELVALSDNLGFMELSQEFLCFVTNSKIETPLIYQDNTSLISLVTEGGGIMRTKHMRSRMFLVLEAVKEKRARIRYVHTSGYNGYDWVVDVTVLHSLSQRIENTKTKGKVPTIN